MFLTWILDRAAGHFHLFLQVSFCFLFPKVNHQRRSDLDGKIGSRRFHFDLDKSCSVSNLLEIFEFSKSNSVLKMRPWIFYCLFFCEFNYWKFSNQILF